MHNFNNNSPSPVIFFLHVLGEKIRKWALEDDGFHPFHTFTKKFIYFSLKLIYFPSSANITLTIFATPRKHAKYLGRKKDFHKMGGFFRKIYNAVYLLIM